MQIKLKYWLLFYVSIVFLSCFLFFNYQKCSSEYLKIHYLDIGQGDATLIITPHGQKILIDTGPAGNINQKFKKYFSFFDKEIDLFILTHADDDHIGSIFDILKTFEVKQFVLLQSVQNKAEFKTLIDFIKRHNSSVMFANQNTDLQITEEIFIDFLYPFQNSSTKEQNSYSNSSLVFKLVYNNSSFLFSGDANIKQEKLIVLSGQDLRADIYQAGHHGSKTSSSLLFLQKIQPKITIISAQKDNSYNHPHPEALQRFIDVKTSFLKTFQGGDIIFNSNGESLWKN